MARAKDVSNTGDERVTNRRRSMRHATGNTDEMVLGQENGDEMETQELKTNNNKRVRGALPPTGERRRSKRIRTENNLLSHEKVKEEDEKEKKEEKVKEIKEYIKLETNDDEISPAIATSTPAIKEEDSLQKPSIIKDDKDSLQAKKLKSYLQFASTGQSPYPEFPRPLAEECKRAYQILSTLHGEPTRPSVAKAPTHRAGCGDSPSVLDALIRTILSQNTSNANSTRAKLSMDATYGGSDAWSSIVRGGQAKLQTAIQSGGLAAVKSKVILSILSQTKEKYGVYSLDHLFDKSDDEAMREMLAFKGVGPKTASCVLLFCLRRPSFAVDTHVHRITGLLGWRPAKATRDQTYAHLDARIPAELKYGLHVLFVKHGRVCEECRAGGKVGRNCELRKAFGKGWVKGEVGDDVNKEEEEEEKELKMEVV